MMLTDAISKRDSLKQEVGKIDSWYIKQKSLDMPKNIKLWDAIEKVIEEIDKEAEQLEEKIDKAIKHIVL